MGDMREALAEALAGRGKHGVSLSPVGERVALDLAAPVVERLIAHARAQALRDAAETIPEVGDVLRRMADREAQP